MRPTPIVLPTPLLRLAAGATAAVLALSLAPGSAGAQEPADDTAEASVSVRLKLATRPAVEVAVAPRVWPVRLVERAGIPVDGKEAILWALLGFLTWHGAPGTTNATGASEPRVLGRITPGREQLRLPRPAVWPPRRLRVLSSATAGEGPP